MDRDTRNVIERATQRARELLEEDFAAQLEGDFDVQRDGAVAAKAGGHLSARQAFQRERIVSAIEHKRAAGMSAADAARDYLRDAAFTTLNRFVALKMLEARELVQECITRGERSAGYREFCGMAPGLPLLPDSAGYRLYIESLFDELSTEVKVLFDRRDPSSVLWPKRATFDQLLEILNSTNLARVWGEDETIGWVYQFFNGQDERRKMREESQAPRNSRELAVRNQFFTPRYVVQFLTDNTLGRIWYEMRGTQTALVRKCEYMVRKPAEEFAPRAKKDPRDLRVLDPACGSGHFLLYAFDLLLAIYEEAYADPVSPKSEATGKTLAEDYPGLDALRKAVPGLVLAHNLHGVDIDPRCAQIAQLALWMRAQKAYRDFGFGRAERAQIRRSNIVVAEPLVADDQIAKEFVAKLRDAELGRVFESLVESLNLAGDLGLLLRVERLVANHAMRDKTQDLFALPEDRIRSAIHRFVSDESSGPNTRRRLFAEDAVYGLALLGLAEGGFDVVLMNPPFGAETARATQPLADLYPNSKNDLFSAFVERGVELLAPGGKVGAITSRTGFFLPSFQAWRELVVLREAPPTVVADLGLGVMDAALVEAAAYCLEKRANSREGVAVFLRALEAANKEVGLRSAVECSPNDLGRARFEVNPELFSVVPGSPFAYWVDDATRNLFRTLPLFESEGRTAKVGPSTADDFRYLRCWWEVDVTQRHGLGEWIPFAKGGKYSPYYADLHLVIDWESRRRTFLGFIGRPGRTTERPNALEFFFRPGLTWPLRTKSELSVRLLPGGAIFGHKGPAAFVQGDVGDDLLALCAAMQSRSFRYLVKMQLAAADSGQRGGVAHSYEAGVIQRTPVPSLSAAEKRDLSERVKKIWQSKLRQDSSVETSHAFVSPLVVLGARASLPAPTESLEREIEELMGERFGLSAPAGVYPSANADLRNDASRLQSDADEDDEEGVATSEMIEVFSWLVGVAFGRFDPRIATCERAMPLEPEPFSHLRTRSPGMYPDGEGPADRRDIHVDDEGHTDDLAAHAQAVAERVKVEVPASLRAWLAKEFFPLHIRMYSKSRRKAPIYWQLATPSASYSVWLYIHAFTKDTLFRVQNDYVSPKLAHEERRMESLTSELRDGATASQRKQLAAQKALVEDLQTFLAEVKRVAPLWKPNLDDGVIINFAPLWRLVPQNKSWQKELKSTWDALCEGEYDWAHLAMHLWPERVVPKCTKDRSLAIAHGLEDVFWVEGGDGKWTARKTPPKRVDELVKERTSPAVKSALKSMLEAPVASGKSTGRKGGSHPKAAATAAGGDA